MLGIHELWLFVISGVLLNISPGPDTAYIVGRSVQMGWRGGAAAALGISCGCLVHVVRRGDRPVGVAGGLIGRVHGDQVGRRGLSLLHRADHDAVAAAPACGCRRRSASACDFAASGVLAGRADQRAQPESGAVLSRFPAAIRGGGCTAQGGRLPAARNDLHHHRHAVVSWRGGVRRPRRRPHHAIGSSGALDQPRAGRAVRLSRRSHRRCFRPGEYYRSRCRRGRSRAKSSRSGTSGGRLRVAFASAPPGR